MGNSAVFYRVSKRGKNSGKHAVRFPRFPRRGSFHNLCRRELRLGAPTAWTKLEHMPVMQQAIEHGTDCGCIAQQFAPIFHRPIGSDQGAGAFVTTHDDLQQIFSRCERQLTHAEIVDDQQGQATTASMNSLRVPSMVASASSSNSIYVSR